MMRSSVTFIALVSLLLFTGSGAQAATCSDCHGMPPIDAAYRNISTGGFKGSHQTHQPAVAAPGNCAICHSGSAAYAVDHMDEAIELAANINNSPVAATYSKGVFFNQTSRPVMGTCANVNCHFEQVTPAWSIAPLVSPGSCNVCHGAPPADGNHPASSGAGKKHGDYYGTTATSCVKCHPDHTTEAKPFAHATSAGHRSLIVGFSVPNSGGSYSGSLGYPAYLPSQNPARNGTCSGLYCHSDGNGGAPNTLPVWGTTLPADCSGCHGGAAGSARVLATGKHPAHVNNGVALGTNFGCVECHARTVSNNTTIGNVGKHVNSFKDYSGVRAGAYTSGTGSCSNIYCHTDGKGRQNVPFTSANGWKSTATLNCLGCHGNDSSAGSFASQFGEPNYSNAGAGAVRANSHRTSNNRHVTVAADCGNCHSATTATGTSILAGSTSHLDGVVTLAAGNGKSFTWTGAAKACSNVSCHGLSGVFSGTNVQWGAPSGCLICHGGDATTSAPITLGKHAAHVNNAGVLGTNFGCAECHAKTVSNNTTISNPVNHMNGFADYSGVRAGRSTSYSTATGVCSATYCHTDGKGLPKMTAANNWKSAATLNCTGCHGSDPNAGSFTSRAGEPNYSNAGSGVARANSHQKHVSIGTSDCQNCHSTTTTTGTSILAGATSHLDGGITVVAGNGKSFTWTAGTKTCSAISCHNNNSATWGATLNCQDCHGNAASASVADFGATFWNNGTMSKMQMTGTGSWAGNGHGLASGTYPGSGNPAANFGVVTNQCEFCHDPTVGHYLASNPFRLRNYSTAAYGRSAPCLVCHSATGTGVTIGTTTKIRTTSKAIEADHYGTKHTTALNGGQFCWDCHDPHGTGNSNQYMVRANPAVVSNSATGAPTTQSSTAVVFTLSATPTGTDYAKSTAPFNGVCNVCHTTTNHYTQTSGDSHNSTTRCTSCHGHTGSPHGSDAFKPTGGHTVPYYTHNADVKASGNSTCLGCHVVGTSASVYPAAVLGNPPDCMGCHKKAAPVTSGTTAGANCSSCHGDSTATTANYGRPTGTAFPDRQGYHGGAQDSNHGTAVCSTCHSGLGTSSGSGSGVNHGPGNRGTNPNLVGPMVNGITPTNGTKGAANTPVTCVHGTISTGCSGGGTQTGW
jgi:predicted CxxxxCH...CXXCH cytochrome family protein